MLGTWGAAEWLRYGLQLPLQFLALATVGTYLLGIRVRPWFAWAITVGGILAFVGIVIVQLPLPGHDLWGRWIEGGHLLRGESPYLSSGCLYLPTAFPLFAAFALLSFPMAVTVWTILNAVGFVGLTALAYAALRTCPGNGERRVPAPLVGVLTVAVLLSGATRYHMESGQLALLVTLALVLALYASQRQRAALAGLGLTLATIKPGTLAPFLLLFHRKTDRAIWAWTAALSLTLCSATTALVDVPGRLSECLDNIRRQSQPGGMNNHASHVNVEMVSIDRALHYAGVEERSVARGLQWAILLVLGGWLAWRVLGPDPLPAAAAWSLAAFYAALFLYHRIYDMPILVVPLLYAVGRTLATSGVTRQLYACCAVSILGVLYFRWETVTALTYAPAPQSLGGQLLLAVAAPYAIWLTLLGMGLLAAAEHRLRRNSMSAQVRVQAA